VSKPDKREKDYKGEKLNISIGNYLTPDLAELLVLLREAAIDLSDPR
jgi:hypothetical protein